MKAESTWQKNKLFWTTLRGWDQDFQITYKWTVIHIILPSKDRATCSEQGESFEKIANGVTALFDRMKCDRSLVTRSLGKSLDVDTENTLDFLLCVENQPNFRISSLLHKLNWTVVYWIYSPIFLDFFRAREASEYFSLVDSLPKHRSSIFNMSITCWHKSSCISVFFSSNSCREY